MSGAPVLVIDQTAIINFTLKPATLAEAVTVTGESAVLDEARTQIAGTVSQAEVNALPVRVPASTAR